MNFFVKSTDILGYAMDGYILCPACYREYCDAKNNGIAPSFEEPGHPIFVDEYCGNVEPGTVEPCDHCGTDIYQDMD